MRGFYQKLGDILEDIFKVEFDIELKALIEVPIRHEFGDFSCTNALQLASTFKKNPLDIANDIKAALEKKVGPEVEKIDVIKPGFVNIFLSQQELIKELNDILDIKENYFKGNIKRQVLIEYCSANPTGPLSIAHGRQAIVGDAIANILKFCGNDVEREYYVNDAGRQLDLLVESVQAWINLAPGQEPNIPEGGYRGQYVKVICDIVKTNNQWQVDPASFNLKNFVLNYILEWIKRDLESLGIFYNTWTSQQKMIDDKKVEDVLGRLLKDGHMFNKDDALWFGSEKFGDTKDRVIRKSDGELTYFASDIALHRDKIERGHQKLIALWGPDHHGYIARVKAAIEALGYDSKILDVLIIQLVSIKTKERMSRRAGTAILLSELVEDVGRDAARFYYLTRRNSSLLEFDIDLAKEASVNNPLYYIQYACARIESIFRKCDNIELNKEKSKYLTDEEELILLRRLLQFSYALEKSYNSLEPVFIIEYIKNLAGVFHKFYEKKRIVGETDDVANARVNLLIATKTVFHSALNILGITPVEKM